MGAIATVALFVALIAFVIAFPVREPDVSGLCTIPPSQPHVELRNVTASRQSMQAEIFVVNPSDENVTTQDGPIGIGSYSVARNGKLAPGPSAGYGPVEQFSSVRVAPHDAVRLDTGVLRPTLPNGSFAPGRYVLLGKIYDALGLCGVARVDVV